MIRAPEVRPWLGLYGVAVSILMIVFDAAIYAISVPSILIELKLPSSSLVWIWNAYMLPLGGFLLLGGRLGDFFGHRRMFLVGAFSFAAGMMFCGFSQTSAVLVVARAVQGLAAALMCAISLSLLVALFPDESERTRAIAVFGVIWTVGNVGANLLGGFLIRILGWHWVFLMGAPVAVVAGALSLASLPADIPSKKPCHPDFSGALVMIVGVSLAVYVFGTANTLGWLSSQTESGIVAVTALVIIFFKIQRRAREPLIPLSLFSMPNFAAVNSVSLLSAAGASAVYVFTYPYLQSVLHYDSLQVGLAFVPGALISALVLAFGAPGLIKRFGAAQMSWMGLLLAAGGLGLSSRAPVTGHYATDVFPALLLIGIGGGISGIALQMIAMRDVGQDRSGVASGVFNTSGMFGGVLGPAILITLADRRTHELGLTSRTGLEALSIGYHTGFLGGALLTCAAAFLAVIAFRPLSVAPAEVQ